MTVGKIKFYIHISTIVKKCNPFCHSLHEVELIYCAVSLHIDEIFQVFISCHIYAYNSQIMKTQNFTSQKKWILHNVPLSDVEREDISQSWLHSKQTRIIDSTQQNSKSQPSFPSVSLSHLAVHLVKPRLLNLN